MPYTVNNTRGSIVSTVNDGTTASIGGITLIGKNFTGYGETIAEDFIKLLENNANTSAPSDPQEGQLWWDTTNQSLKARLSGSTGWHPLTVHVGATYPHATTTGSLWYNTSTKQLNVNVDGATGYKQFASASDKSYTQVVELTATHVDDASANNNGYVVSDKIQVIAEKYFKGPVFITDWPKEIKPFYMRLNEDEKTVSCMDLIVPRVGELIGGSAREERINVLKIRLGDDKKITQDYWWYLETRKYGSVKHAGFGMGFERLIMLLTGVTNIRDVIAYPRTPHSLDY